MTEPHDFLQEDLGVGDVTSNALLTDERVGAVIIANHDCTISGIEEAIRIFTSEGLRAVPKFRDGQHVSEGQEVMSITGDAKALLRTERLALNFMCRMSGIATATRKLVDQCRSINTEVQISATRKTTPGFREWEKKAVVHGGGVAHRTGLWDQILIKDNHLKLTGTITQAIEKAKSYAADYHQAHGKPLKVEVEVMDMGGAIEAAKSSPDIIMLDNMEPFEVEAVASEIRKINNMLEIEVSGGITPENITQYAPYPDVISLGWLTHSAKAADLSLDIVEIHNA